MIRDDQIDAQLAGADRGVCAADAAVDRNDQRDAVRVEPLDGRRLQPVPVLQPFRDEVAHVGAEQLEAAAQDDRRRHAVHVVVAVNGDPLLPRNRGQDALDGDAHVRKRHRIVQLVERGVEETRGVLGIGEAALAQQPRDDRRHIQGRCERRGGGFVAGCDVPAGRNGGHQRIVASTFLSNTASSWN